MDLANHLLRATVVSMALAHSAGVSGIMEHPAPADWVAAAPTSWRLPEVQRIAALPQAQLVRLDQCMYGATAQKPTTLLCVHLDNLATRVSEAPNRGLCNHLGRHAAAFGRTSTGE